MAESYNGGNNRASRTITKKLKNGKFMKIYFDKNGKAHKYFFKKKKNKSVKNIKTEIKKQKEVAKKQPTKTELERLAAHFKKFNLK